MVEKRRLKRRKESTTAYIGLGSNLGRREETIARALELLEGDSSATRVVAVSSLRETDPLGYESQPRFLNGAAMLETSAPARELLQHLLELERQLGRDRERTPRFGPRTIDLDLLLYGEETIAEPGLVVPHPRLHERAFVLEPLAELNPRLLVPGRGPVSALLAGLE
ncbi:MAG TPA: 2-amino-4-hydroxy-6-hydroxymethyldihydropteridine diphosphokinase [Gaiellaceae bacterium]